MIYKGSTARATPRLETGQPFLEAPLVQTGLIGRSILTPFGVAKQAAEFASIRREELLARRNTRRGDKSAFGRDSFGTDKLTYSTQGYGWESPVSDFDRGMYATEFDCDEIARAMVLQVLERELEIRIATEIFNVDATHFYSSNSDLYLDVTTDWDSASGDIIGDVQFAAEKIRRNTGMYPNTLVFSAAHIASIRKNTAIAGQFKGGSDAKAIITLPLLLSSLPAILGIEKILIGGGVYNSANEGQTNVFADVWSDDYAWLGITADGPNLMQPCVGRTFVLDTVSSEDGYDWDLYYEPQTKTDVWQAEHWTDEVIFDPYFGFVLKIDT
jgi:hypothetical protein